MPELISVSPWGVRAILGLCGGVFVGTLLAAFSASGRSDLGTWWLAAMALVVVAWGAVALSSWIGWRFSMPFRNGPRWVCFAGLAAGALVLFGIVGLILPLSPWGVALTAAPIVLGVAWMWSRAGAVGIGTGVLGGLVLFFISIRLFTLPATEIGEGLARASKADDDVLLLSWNIGRGAPFYGAGAESSVEPVANTIKQQGAHVVCLQEVASDEYLQNLLKALGSDWRGERVKGKRSAAVLSRIGGVFEALQVRDGERAPMLLRVKSNKGVLQFVSCHAAEGRNSAERRALADQLLNDVRSPQHKTVLAGDFGIDPESRWNFLKPAMTDSAGFDRATWRAIQVLGQDSGWNRGPTASLGRRPDWVVVDGKMVVSDYRILESARVGRMNHSPVLVRVGLGLAGRASPLAGGTGQP